MALDCLIGSREATAGRGGTPEIIRMVELVNDRLPPLENSETGTRVGIGVVTGNDGFFITKDPRLVEPERLLPLAMAADGSNRHSCGGLSTT